MDCILEVFELIGYVLGVPERTAARLSCRMKKSKRNKLWKKKKRRCVAEMRAKVGV